VKKFHFLIVFVLVAGGCGRKYLRTETKVCPLSSEELLNVSYFCPSNTQLVLSPSLQCPYLRLQKDVYKRSWFPGNEVTYAGISLACCIGGLCFSPLLYNMTGYLDWFALVLPGPAMLGLGLTHLVFPIEVRQDTVMKDLGKIPSVIYVCVGESPQKSFSLSRGTKKVQLHLKDFYDWVPLGEDMVLHVTSSLGVGCVDIKVSSSAVDKARTIEADAQALLEDARLLEEKKDYEGTLRVYEEILHRYKDSSVAKSLDGRVRNLEMVVRKQMLDRIAGKSLASLVKFGFSSFGIAYARNSLSALDDGVKFIAVTKGLGLDLKTYEAIRFYNRLTPYQQLYAVLLLAETLSAESSSDPSERWFVKRGFLKEWFLTADIADLLAEIDPSQLINQE
jgi:hypothetical protein